jgi:predicted esterase
VIHSASISHIPIWIFHGAEDPTVSVLYSHYMLEALTRAGAHPGFTQYPEVGHFSPKSAYTDQQMFA